MRQRQLFLYFLTDSTGTTFYYVDGTGKVQTTGQPTWLKNDPEGWLGSEVSFGRNPTFYGLNRSYKTPLKFIGDGAQIIREQFYQGAGVEQLVQLVILKYNYTSDVNELYYKGLLDLMNMEDDVAEGVTVPLIEGGALAMLKTYQDTVFEIPMDGSDPDNVMVNMDGVLVQDTFNYTITPQAVAGSAGQYSIDNQYMQILSCVYTGNEADNFGTIYNSPTNAGPKEISSADYFSTSSNFVFSYNQATVVNIKGSITIKTDGGNSEGDFPQFFQLMTATNRTQPMNFGGGGNGIAPGANYTNSTGNVKYITSLVPYQNLPANYETGVPLSFTPVINARVSTYSFNVALPLNQNEPLFLVFYSPTTNFNVLAGGFNLQFNSAVQQGFVWGMSAWNVYQKIVKGINALSGTSGTQVFAFDPASTLLQNNPNLILTSGDALRASGDPNYTKFYNPPQTNLTNPTYTFFDFQPSYGPVGKVSLSSFFKSMNVLLNASLSNQNNPTPGQNEQLFFEQKEYVFDSSEVTIDLTALSEISKVKLKPANDYVFNLLKIGYNKQDYDEKAGKWEYNTTAQWSTPIRTVNKTLELVSDFRTDSYGIEYTRANLTTDTKSGTYNDSDTSIFVLNVNTNQTYPAYQTATFTPYAPLNQTWPNNVTSTDNQRIKTGTFAQGVSMPTLTGGEFCAVTSSSPSIFVFSYPTDVTLSEPVPNNITFSFSGVINGQYPCSIPAPTIVTRPYIVEPILNYNGQINGDAAIVYAFYNNTVVQSWTFPYLGVNQSINGTFTYTGTFNSGDCIYMKVVTTPYCTCTIGEGTGPQTEMIVHDSSYPTWFIAQAIGQQTINAGTGWGLTDYSPYTYGQPIVFANYSGSYTNQALATPPGLNKITQQTEYGMQAGFPMFVFNEVMNNNNFTYDFWINYLVNTQSLSGGSGSGYAVVTNLYHLSNLQLPFNSQPSPTLTCVIDGQQQNMVGAGHGPSYTVRPSNTNPQLQLNLGDCLFILVSSQADSHFTDLEITDPVTDNAGTQTKSGPNAFGCYFKLIAQVQAYDLLREQYSSNSNLTPSIAGIPTLLGNVAGTNTPITTGAGAPYNIEQFTPRRLLQTHANWINSGLYSVRSNSLTFQTLDRNRFLQTTLNGVNYKEGPGTGLAGGTVEISTLGDPLFYPFIVSFETEVPYTFQQVMTGAANGYIKCSYAGVDIYGFPLNVSAMPALNETQTWELLIAPPTDITALTNLNYSGLSNLQQQLMANQIFVHRLNPVQFVPLGISLNSLYHYIQMDQDWYVNQTGIYIDTNDYAAPWQQNDVIDLQVFTDGLGNVQATIIDCNGNTISVTNFTNITDTPILAPLLQWEASIPLTGLTGVYYMILSAGVGGDQIFISDPLNVQVDQPQTLLFQYTHNTDTQSAVFSTGWTPTMRVDGWIDRFMAEANFASHEDQPADLTTINGIPWRYYTMNIGYNSGAPDWVADKVNRITLLSTMNVDGTNYSRNIGAKWDSDVISGQLKKYWRLQIRESKATYGTTITVGTGPTTKPVVVFNIDASAFGNNSQSNITQVTQTD